MRQRYLKPQDLLWQLVMLLKTSSGICMEVCEEGSVVREVICIAH